MYGAAAGDYSRGWRERVRLWSSSRLGLYGVACCWGAAGLLWRGGVCGYRRGVLLWACVAC